MDLPSANPNDVLLWFEGFEDYDDNALIAYPGGGLGGWFGRSGSEYRCYSSIMNHTNKIFSGDKTCLHSSGEMEHTFPSASNVVFRMGIWDEDASKTPYIRLYHSSGGHYNYIQFGFNDFITNYGYKCYSKTSGAWMRVATGDSRSNSMHEFIIYVDSVNGTTFFNEGGNYLIGDSSQPHTTVGYEKMDLHTIDGVRISGNYDFFIDHIRVYRSFSTPDPFQVI